MSQPNQSTPSILLIGASRGLGYAMAEEFAARGWNVVGTVRGSGPGELHGLAEKLPGRVAVERVDTTDATQLTALLDRLVSRRFEILFVNAGTATRDQDETIAEVSTDEFVRVMLTNALAPMRTIDTLQGLVFERGLIGVMSSGQGSVASNEKGGHEVYRGSKAALNQYMRSYAARTVERQLALLLLAPGWIRTELGGPNAPINVEDAIPEVTDVLIAKQGRPGLEYLDRNGKTVPW